MVYCGTVWILEQSGVYAPGTDVVLIMWEDHVASTVGVLQVEVWYLLW